MPRAEQDTTKPKKKQYFIRTLDIVRRIVSRLKLRVTLAKKLADAMAAKEKMHSEDDCMREAAENSALTTTVRRLRRKRRRRRGTGVDARGRRRKCGS
jgi:ATP-dependent RNA helicase DDX24/MAK5